MIANSKEKDFQAKQEVDTSGGDSKFSKAPSASSSRQWSAFRNPRIVRVSRTFGGKDRHSKVCTIRGLRDRRIRLSVPTAIQLYDLQDRLGLSQPSKVIDWLIDNTKDDIDKLPPLPIPQGFGHQFHQPFMVSHHESNPSLPPFFDANSMFMKDGGFHSLGIKINSGLEVHHEDQNIMARPKYWEVEASMRARNKEVDTAAITEKGKWIRTNEGNDQDGVSNYSGQVLSAQKFFPLGSSHASSLLGLPPSNPIPMPFNSYCHWDPSNLSLSQFGSHGLQLQSQTETALSSSSNAVSLALPSSSLALSSGSQLFFCPPPATLPSLFPYSPTYVTTGPVENDSRPEINHFQLLGSSSQHPPVLHHHQNSSRTMSSTMKPFSLSVNPAGPPGLLHSLSSNESHPGGKDNAES